MFKWVFLEENWFFLRDLEIFFISFVVGFKSNGLGVNCEEVLGEFLVKGLIDIVGDGEGRLFFFIVLKGDLVVDVLEVFFI